MIVMKFGGSSVGDAERITNVCNIVKSKNALILSISPPMLFPSEPGPIP